MGNPNFKPTRRELAEVRRFAHECEVHAAADARLRRYSIPSHYSRVARSYSDRAFKLSQRIAARAGQ